jgi:hypothetical protein
MYAALGYMDGPTEGRGVYSRNYMTLTSNYGFYARVDGSNASANKYGIRTLAHGSGTNYGVYGQAWGGSTNWSGYFSDSPVRVTDSISVGPTATRFSMQAVNRSTTGVLFSHPSALVELEWDLSTHTLSLDNRTASPWVLGIMRTQENNSQAGDSLDSSSGANGADLTVSGSIAVGADSAQWNSTATTEGNDGPGLTFWGTSVSNGLSGSIQGIVLFWY